jgi:hypothetical protein
MATETKKKTTRKRAARKAKRRETVENLGLVIAQACRDAKRELPQATPTERRDWCVKLLNARLDIPLLTEEHEERLLELLVDVVSDIIFKKRYGEHRENLDGAKALLATLRK